MLEEIAAEITPDADEREEILAVIGEVKSVLTDLDAAPLVVGSFAKNTDLAGDRDIDLFILFPPGVDREELEKAWTGHHGVAYHIRPL